jgi:hypothetical protein
VCVCERVWESVTARISAHGARPSEGRRQEGVGEEVEARAEPRKNSHATLSSAAVASASRASSAALASRLVRSPHADRIVPIPPPRNLTTHALLDVCLSAHTWAVVTVFPLWTKKVGDTNKWGGGKRQEPGEGGVSRPRPAARAGGGQRGEDEGAQDSRGGAGGGDAGAERGESEDGTGVAGESVCVGEPEAGQDRGRSTGVRCEEGGLGPGDTHAVGESGGSRDSRHGRDGDRGGRGGGGQRGWYHWQVAGSNNLLQAQEDMRALVLGLNSKLTDGDILKLVVRDRNLASRATLINESTHVGLMQLIDIAAANMRRGIHGRVAGGGDGRGGQGGDCGGEDGGMGAEQGLFRAKSRQSLDGFRLDTSSTGQPPGHLLYFGDLWSDVMLLVVFVVLPPKALCMCAQVCKSWNELAQHDLLWEPHLRHLSAGLGLTDNLEAVEASIGKLVVDGMITYKYLYKQTFCIAARATLVDHDARHGTDKSAQQQLVDIQRQLRLADSGEHDVRRLLVRSLFGLSQTVRSGMENIGRGVKATSSGIVAATMGGALSGGAMAARMGTRVPVGKSVARTACAVGGGVLGGVGGAVGGTFKGVVYGVPSLVRGCVSTPLRSLASLLDETASVIRSTPGDMLGPEDLGSPGLESVHGGDGACDENSGPAPAVSHLERGLLSFQQEVGASVEGLVVSPVHGVQSDGIPGLVRGGSRGLVNAVCKPVVGTLVLGGALATGLSCSAENPALGITRPCQQSSSSQEQNPRHPDASLKPCAARRQRIFRSKSMVEGDRCARREGMCPQGSRHDRFMRAGSRERGRGEGGEAAAACAPRMQDALPGRVEGRSGSGGGGGRLRPRRGIDVCVCACVRTRVHVRVRACMRMRVNVRVRVHVHAGSKIPSIP